MTERFLEGLCDLKSHKTDWNTEGCDKFWRKDKQVGRLKVCANCVYFTVGEFEIYPEQIAGEGMAIGRVA